jgi:exopolyphosphatase/guanosine-5'-triphosphate,3'-diphosphate pyrophosphatase
VSVFAAIDCGTNSIRLLVSRVEADGSLTELNRDNIIVRLGQDVDATGRFADEALARVDAALEIYADRMVSLGAVDVVMGRDLRDT